MNRRRALRWAGAALAVLLFLAGFAVSGLYFWARASVQDLEGSAPLAGLDSTVTVYVDGAAIPHVFAASEADLFRAQGWIHASERLWQLELWKRTARGRLAEVFGEAGLGSDRLIRTLDLWGAAERSLESLPPGARSLLEAYAEGVNARIRSWSGPWPPEFLLLDIEPGPWTPRHSVAVGKLMALDLTSWQSELARYVSRRALPPEKARYLTLPYPDWGPTIVDPGTAPLPEGERLDTASVPSSPPGGDASRAPRITGLGRTPDPTARGAATGVGESAGSGLPEVPVGTGFSASNSWAVAGVRSWAGQPLLANDMHLTLRAPSTWYLNALHAEGPDLHVAGLSIPGVPGVIVGYNREIAWGFTNGMVDDIDFVVENVAPDRSVYRTGDGWERFSVRRETIRVLGRPDPVVLPVRSTIRGPVLSDILPGLEATMSVLWTGLLPTTELRGILAMNRARDPEAFDRAIQVFDAPQQNVIFATARGELGYRLSGRVPIRTGWDGSSPVPFRSVGEGWSRFWPSDSTPATRNPPGGFLATANNLQARGLFDVLGTAYPVPFRARRIVDRLQGELAWTVDLMRGLQTDTRSLFADRVLHRAVAAADRIDADSAGSLLGSWNHQASLDSRPTTLFYVWLYRLRNLIAGDELADLEPAWRTFPDDALLKTLEDEGSPWVDDIRTAEVETLVTLEERAMRDALAAAAGRPWGEVHHERSAHPLGSVEWLDRIFGFDVGPYPAPGGPHTVRADGGDWSALDSTAWHPPFGSTYGPSQRFLAELRPGRSLGYFLLPTGQSGNPFSPHYRDMASRWLENDLLRVPLYREAAFERAERTLQLLSR